VALVGTPGGGDRAKSEDQPHAKQVAHAPQPSMWGQDAEGESVPVAGDAERPLPECTAECHQELLKVTKMQVSGIIAKYPGRRLGKVGANGCRERILENNGPLWVPNSPFGNLAVRLGRLARARSTATRAASSNASCVK
jgi:hypothetical protein